MRPSWPPPRMPIVAPGSSSRPRPNSLTLPLDVGRSGDGLGLRLAPGVEPRRERRIGQRQHAGGEQRRVDRAGLADRQRADRNARPASARSNRAKSTPDSAFDSTGTPNTGRLVIAAVMPGRCAAPPAPGDDHLEARGLGALGEGVRAGPACDGPRRCAPRGRRRARRASRRRAAWSASRTGCP